MLSKGGLWGFGVAADELVVDGVGFEGGFEVVVGGVFGGEE